VPVKKIISKTTALLFIVIAGCPLFYSVHFLYRQLHIRHEMKEKLEAQYVQTITLHKKDLHWFKENKEIKIGDHLFDVKEWYADGDNVILKGLYDKQEDALHAQLDQLQRNNNDNKSSIATFAQLLLMSLFFEPQISATVFPVKLTKTASFYFAVIPELNLPRNFPPPKA
jgi:hypothetical protein